VAVARGYPTEVLQQWDRIPIDAQVPLSECVWTATPVWLESSEAWTARYPALAGMPRSSHSAAAAIPLLAHGRALGAMGLSFNAARTFDADDRMLIVNLTQQCALALERAQLFEAERTAHAAAEAALRARDEFLSVAAHELRTPLTSLRLYAQHLVRKLSSDRVPDPEELRRSFVVFDSQTDRLTRLVTELLDVSRIESGRFPISPETVDLAQLVGDAVERSRLRSEDRVISLETPPLAQAEVDPLRIEQVVTNLLDNAVKFSPADTPVEVTIRQATPGEWEIGVRDHGVGIEPEHRARVFERFYQAKVQQHNPGLGLGLYVSRQIAELHGGQLSAEFPPDGGSRFLVRLPIGRDGVS
jgi:signal transduction histidine kinase